LLEISSDEVGPDALVQRVLRASFGRRVFPLAVVERDESKGGIEDG
jgi:hypothetical protein